jgi:hypothetical protein
MDLVNRYLADAHGPPPRAPLRFWIGGEWVDVTSPEPERRPQASQRGGLMLRSAAPNLTAASPGATTTEAATAAVRLRGHNDDAAPTAWKPRGYGQRDDHDVVRSQIARLREQRDAGELSETAFATQTAELLMGAMAAHIASEGDPSNS